METSEQDIVEFIDYMLLQSTENVVLEEISCDDIAECYAGKSIRELDAGSGFGEFSVLSLLQWSD